MTILTTTKSGKIILARKMGGFTVPAIFPNRIQAEKKICEFQDQGIQCYLIGNQPYWIEFPHEPRLAQTDSDQPARSQATTPTE